MLLCCGARGVLPLAPHWCCCGCFPLLLLPWHNYHRLDNKTYPWPWSYQVFSLDRTTLTNSVHNSRRKLQRHAILRLENCKNLFLRVETLRTVARIKSRQRRKYNLSTKSRVSIGHNDFKTKAVERYNELANGKLHYVQKCKAVKTSNSLLLNSRN